MENLYRFWRCKSKREQNFLFKIEDWRAEKSITRKLSVIKKLVARGVKEIQLREDTQFE
jgi:hypothetical protein